MEFLKGLTVAVLINVATIVGWWLVGPWLPAAFAAGTALVVTGVYGLNDRWPFVGGYWAGQLVFVILWLAGMIVPLTLLNQGQ